MEARISQGYQPLIEKRLARIIALANFCFTGMIVLSTIVVFTTAYYPNSFLQESVEVFNTKLTNLLFLAMNASLCFLRSMFAILASYYIWEFIKLLNSTQSEVHKHCRATIDLALKTSRFWEWATFSTTLLDIMALGAIQELSCMTFFVGIFIRLIFLFEVNVLKTMLQRVVANNLTAAESL